MYDDDSNGISHIKQISENKWLLVEKDGDKILKEEYNQTSIDRDDNGLPVVFLWRWTDENPSRKFYLRVKEGKVSYFSRRKGNYKFYAYGYWESKTSTFIKICKTH